MEEKTERQDLPGKQEMPEVTLKQILNLQEVNEELKKSIEAADNELKDRQGKLNDLVNEFNRVQNKKEEIKKQIKEVWEKRKKQTEEILGKEEKRKSKLFEEIKKIEDEKDSLEKQCDGLRNETEQIICELDGKKMELQEKNKELEDIKAQLTKSYRKYFFGKTKWIVTAVVSILVVLIFFGWVRSNFEVSELNDEVFELNDEISGLNDEISKLNQSLSDIEEYASPAMVKVNSVYNSDAVSKLSDELKASEMRYLEFNFNVRFFDANVKEGIIYIDIYYPNGSLMRSSENSPDGHTFDTYVYDSEEMKNGWGNKNASPYVEGTYRVDFIYEDVIIHSQKIEITE